MPTLSAETLRTLVISFPTETDREVKNQIINAVVRLFQDTPEASKQSEQAKSLLRHVLELSKFDIHYDIRDKARLLFSIFFDPDSPLRKLERQKLMEVRDEVVRPQANLYVPNTISQMVRDRQMGRKVEGYSKLWDDFYNVEALRPFLTEDTSALREEETEVRLADILPPQTHYSSEDTPKIGGAGLKQRVPTVNAQALQEFLESSGEEEEEDEEESGSEDSNS